MTYDKISRKLDQMEILMGIIDDLSWDNETNESNKYVNKLIRKLRVIRFFNNKIKCEDNE